MSEPSTGGAITGGNRGYKGGSGNSSSFGSSGSSSSKATSIDFSSFTIDANLTRYEGDEVDSTTPETATVLTSEDIAQLVGKMSYGDYALFIGGVEEFYDDQIATYESVLKGEDGLYNLRDRLKYGLDQDVSTRFQYRKEQTMRETDDLLHQYETYTDFWENYEREHGLEPFEGYNAFYEMSYEDKMKWIEENSPEYKEILASEEAYIKSELDPYIERQFGDLGITTYEEYVALREQTDSTINELETMIKNAKQLKTTAKYDYLPFLEDYNNYKTPEFDYDKYAISFYQEAYVDRGGPNNMSNDFSYSKYKSLHPEVTPLQFVKMASKYTTYSGDLHDIDGADLLLTLAKVSDKFPQFEKTYNYLYEQDPALALQYLKDNQYVFNNLEGQMRANEFLKNLGVPNGDNDFLKAIANELQVSYEGLMDGLGTFGEGICFTAEALLVTLGIMDENRTMSAEEYKKLYILQALLPLEEKEKMGLVYKDEQGNYHNTDPNSLIDYTISYSGAVLNNNYEISQGIGNMAPSMLVSLYCPAAGSWLMALSSGGNAYHGAMVEGKDQFTALLYGAFTGGSEALSERLLGGLPGLSNIEVKGLWSYLKAVAKEGSQEIFQFLMDKVYRCIMMGEPFPQTPEEWEEFKNEAIKEGVYGAITAGLMQIPNLAGAYLHKGKKGGAAVGGVAGLEVETETNVETDVETDPKTSKTHLTEAEALTIAQDILDPNTKTSFADLAGLDAESVQMVTGAMMPDEIVAGLKSLPSDEKINTFAKLSPEGKVAGFDALTSVEKYTILLSVDGNSWIKQRLHDLTPENASKYLKINQSGNIEIDWPVYGGCIIGTIKPVDSLSGDYVISRVGGRSGNCWGLHFDIDPADINTPETDATIRNVTMDDRGILQGDSVLTGDENAFKGVFHADKYNETIHILSEIGNGTDRSVIEARLVNMGYTETQAVDLIKAYANILTQNEWSGPNNIYEARGLQGEGGAVTGAYGTTAGWEDLSGGATQMTTQLPAKIMIECGIITDVTDGIMIDPK